MCGGCCSGTDPIFDRPPIIAAALSRSHLRDSRRRLIAIRLACGFNDQDEKMDMSEEEEEKLDPFTKAVRRFNRSIDEARMAATDSMQDLEERVAIKRCMDTAKEQLSEIGEICDHTQWQLNAAELKSKNQDKLERLQAVFEQYQQTRVQCEVIFNDAKVMTKSMTWNAPSQLPQSRAYKTALRILAEKSGVKSTLDAADAAAAAERGDDDDGDDDGVDLSKISLETDPETKEQMQLIKKQKTEVKMALNRIHHSLQRVHDMAMLLRQETQSQVTKLDQLDEQMQFQVDNIRNGNKRLERLMQTMQPFNVCVNCSILIIVLSAAGFLLYHFGVIPEVPSNVGAQGVTG